MGGKATCDARNLMTMAKSDVKLLGDTCTVTEVACLWLHDEAERMSNLSTEVYGRNDIEAVHDMRVAIRRLRVLIKMFRPFWLPGFALHDSSLKWIGTRLGHVRDL